MTISNYIDNNKLVIPVNGDGISNDEIIRMIPSIRQLCRKKKLILQFKANGNQLSPSLINIEQVINCKDEEERLDLIYNYVCDYLDNDIKKHNYCNFINEKCVFS